MAGKSELDAVGCEICLEILYEPITMPCAHRLCKPCFNTNFDMTSMHCPFCKKRLSTWRRKAKNVDELIDQKLWKRIQTDFPTEIEKRLAGDGTTLFREDGFTHDFTFENGVLGKELQDQAQKLQAEESRRRSKENFEQEREDEVLARQLEKEYQENSHSVSEIASTSTSTKKFVQSRKLFSTALTASMSTASSSSSNTMDILKKRNTDAVEESIEIVGEDPEFIEKQREILERIEQQKQDEEFARQLQSKENSDAVSNGSPSFSTRKRTNSSVTPSPSRSKVNKKLILSKQTKGQTRQMTIEEMVKQGLKRKRDDI